MHLSDVLVLTFALNLFWLVVASTDSILSVHINLDGFNHNMTLTYELDLDFSVEGHTVTKVNLFFFKFILFGGCHHRHDT